MLLGLKSTPAPTRNKGKGKTLFSRMLLLAIVILSLSLATQVYAVGSGSVGGGGAGGGSVGSGSTGGAAGDGGEGGEDGGGSSSSSSSSSSSTSASAAAPTGAGTIGSPNSLGTAGSGQQNPLLPPGDNNLLPINNPNNPNNPYDPNRKDEGGGSNPDDDPDPDENPDDDPDNGPPPPPPDLSPPVFHGATPGSMVLSADHQKGVSFGLHFSDDSPPVRYAHVTVEGVNHGSTSFTHDFSRPGTYDLVFSVCDSAPARNCTGDIRLSNYFTVVANVPEWSASNCRGSSCPSRFILSSGTQIADGVEEHFAEIKLVDRYGNPVITVPGIKQVDTTFNFRNTVHLDQITGTGDGAVFSSSEWVGLDRSGDISLIKLTDGNRDGTFRVTTQSYTPTSVSYIPIRNDNFDLNLESVDYRVSRLGSASDVGATAVNANISAEPASRFAFYPSVLAIPAALIWTGESYVADFRGAENITVNAVKRFNTYLLNISKNRTVTDPAVGFSLDSGVDSVLWQRAVIERAHTTTGLNVGLDLDTDGNRTFDRSVNDLSDWIDSLTRNVLRVFRFRATPELALGESIEGRVVANLRAYACYTIGSKEVCHRSEKMEKDVDEDILEQIMQIEEIIEDDEGEIANLYNPGIEILGSIRSIAGTASKQTGVGVNQSLGDVVQNEFQAAITRNIASLLANSESACRLDTVVETASALVNLDCWQRDDDVLYLRDADLTLDLRDSLLPSGARTIVIEDGDLHLRSDLIYPNGASSLGIIVLGGDIFIYPEVTQLVGSVYAEGGLISVNANRHFVEDESSECDGLQGFCDRSFELQNQLHWKGLLATRNTIGGSDKAPFECPTGVSCDTRDIARVYDLTYLRTYHPNSGGERSGTTDSDASFVVEYDSRIQSNAPPLFEATAGSTSNELGASLLEVVRRAVWPF